MKPDLYGVAACIHCMLHGSYMQLEQVVRPGGRKIWMPKLSLKRYRFCLFSLAPTQKVPTERHVGQRFRAVNKRRL